MQPIGGRLGFRCGSEDGPVIVLKNCQPVLDISGMVGSGFVGKAQIGTEESGSEFRYELLGGVSVVSKTAFQIAVKPVRRAYPMNIFMAKNGVIGSCFFEDLKGRQLNEVFPRAVISAVATMPEIGR